MYTHIYTPLSISLSLYIYIYMYISCVYIYIYIYIYMRGSYSSRHASTEPLPNNKKRFGAELDLSFVPKP